MEPSTGASGQGIRGQSSIIAVILVVGIMLAGAVLVVALGATAVNDSEESLSIQRAEKAMTQFDSKAALVALGNTDIQEVSFGNKREATYGVQEGQGWMRVTVENQTAGTTRTILNESLGAITYEVEDTTLAYQGGGVWKRATSNESVMISPPEFHFRNGTLTLPVVNVTGSLSVGSRASIRHEETVRKFPDVAAGNRNPLRKHFVKVTVQSEYYKAWGKYFQDRTDGEVEYDHGRSVVNLSLLTPVKQKKIRAASASLSASGTFNVSGNPLNECHGSPFTDSYNSSQPGDYCSQTPGSEGDLVYGRDIDVSGGGGGSTFNGDVVSGRDVIVGNNIEVNGNINFTDNCKPSLSDCNDAIASGSGGSVNEISGVREAASVDLYVRNRVEAIADENDNDDDRIDSERLDFSENSPSDAVELEAGSYFLERIDLSGNETVFLNTTGGDVTLAVKENVILDDDTNIVVAGDNNVRIFVEGVGTGTDPHFDMGKNTGVVNGDDDATQIRMYGQSNFSATIGDSGGGGNPAKYVGVIYAPPGVNGTGNVTLRKGAIYGGLLTGTTEIPSSGRGTVHYDKALRKEQIISPNAKILKITYLHVSINRIHIE